MAEPTVEEIRTLSKLDFDQADYAQAEPDPLTPVLDDAVAYVENVTARLFADAQPRGYDKLMGQAARMRVEQIVMESAPEVIETVGDIDLIASFSAGPYSETRRDPNASVVIRGGGSAKAPLNPWPALDRILWMLLMQAPGEDNQAVDDRYWYWIQVLGGGVLPAWGIVEVDWGDNALLGPGGFGGKVSTLYPTEE